MAQHSLYVVGCPEGDTDQIFGEINSLLDKGSGEALRKAMADGLDGSLMVLESENSMLVASIKSKLDALGFSTYVYEDTRRISTLGQRMRGARAAMVGLFTPSPAGRGAGPAGGAKEDGPPRRGEPEGFPWLIAGFACFTFLILGSWAAFEWITAEDGQRRSVSSGGAGARGMEAVSRMKGFKLASPDEEEESKAGMAEDAPAAGGEAGAQLSHETSKAWHRPAMMTAGLLFGLLAMMGLGRVLFTMPSRRRRQVQISIMSTGALAVVLCAGVLVLQHTGALASEEADRARKGAKKGEGPQGGGGAKLSAQIGGGGGEGKKVPPKDPFTAFMMELPAKQEEASQPSPFGMMLMQLRMQKQMETAQKALAGLTVNEEAAPDKAQGGAGAQAGSKGGGKEGSAGSGGLAPPPGGASPGKMEMSLKDTGGRGRDKDPTEKEEKKEEITEGSEDAAGRAARLDKPKSVLPWVGITIGIGMLLGLALISRMAKGGRS